MIRQALLVILSMAAIAVLALAIVSLWHDFEWRNTASTNCPLVCITLADGRLWLFKMDHVQGSPRQSVSERRFLGFSYSDMVQPAMHVADAAGRLQPVQNVRCLDLEVPIWPVLVLLTCYPTATFIRGPVRRWRRRRKGLCLKCGYDLTGNTSGRCPECGEGI